MPNLAALALAGLSFAASVRADPAPSVAPAPGTLQVPARLRLLVVAPHPDDEVLGAGGLLQRVRKRHGQVYVVYLTNGDGYLDAVERIARKPTARDFVDYGKVRQSEAVRALRALAIAPARAAFLGFPDGGLAELLSNHWSAQHPFTSPYTGDDRSPYPESLDRNVEYSGIALRRELALTIARFRPTWIAVTGPWDVHPDHCSAYRFVVRALSSLAATNEGYGEIPILAFTVHRPDWPVQPAGAPLAPPIGVSAEPASWESLALDSEELEGKGRALEAYASQMEAMAIVFQAFVRSNEIFAVYPTLPAEPAGDCRPRAPTGP